MKHLLASSILLLFFMNGIALCEEKSLPAGGEENLLAPFNSGFENPLAGGVIPGWETAYGNVQIVGDASHAGRQSLHLANTLPVDPANAKVYSRLLIRVEPGYEYHISAWGKFKHLKFINKSYGVGFGLEELNAEKVINGNWYPMSTYLKYAEGDTDWVRTEASWRPKETTVWLKPFLIIWAEPGSEAWFDDIRVWKTPIAEVRVEHWNNVIENGSFEVRYQSANGLTPNGYEVKAPDGRGDDYRRHWTCVEDVHYCGQTAMRIDGECTVVSVPAYIDVKKAAAQIAVKTAGAQAEAFANLVFYDQDRKIVGKREIVRQKGGLDWQLYQQTLTDIDPKARFVQWEFGMVNAGGQAWFDDLQVNVPSTMMRLPERAKDTAHATVTVDCAVRKKVFESPLNAVDHAGIHYLYSPTIGTAGKFLEGPGRWFQERGKLGFKYLRIHHMYQNNLCEIRQENGKWAVSFSGPRSPWPESDKPFPPCWRQDQDGKTHYDFSYAKYVLDRAVLPGGCKPVIGLEPVPAPMAIDWDPRNLPVNLKEWEELNYHFIKFLVDSYGKDEVRTWIFETGNEPGTENEFHGTTERKDVVNDFIKMQDYTIAGAVRALPDIFIAGPSGPPVAMIEPILDHCATGVNYATGKAGTKIDAISYHGYWGGSGSDMSWRSSEDQILNLQGAISRFHQKTGKQLQLFNTEFAPIYGHDGRSDLKHLPHEADNHIQAIGMLHAGYFSHKHDIRLLAFFEMHPLTDAFFDLPASQAPEFVGKATVITLHGIFKPVCRAYQMMAMLNGGTEVAAETDNDPIYALAAITGKQIKILCYNFDVNPQAGYTTRVDVTVDPAGLGNQFKVTKYELSATKANSWRLAQQMNLTQADCEKEVAIVDKINRESELKPEDAGRVETRNGKLKLTLAMPAYSATLLILENDGMAGGVNTSGTTRHP